MFDLTGEWQEIVDTETCTTNSNWLRPIILCLPAWFRFAQCLRRYRDTGEAFPHLVNAGKYSTTFFVVLFSSLFSSFSHAPLFYAWVSAAVISSLYAYAWDIWMDWGLMDSGAGAENPFLRDEIVYSSKAYYYLAVVEDLVLRFGWAVSMGLSNGAYVDADLLASILAPLEVFRRFVWNFFRLENEHLNNCGKFRAVRDISVAPIDASDQVQIIRMMDEDDGVMAVRVSKKKQQEVLTPLVEAVNI